MTILLSADIANFALFGRYGQCDLAVGINFGLQFVDNAGGHLGIPQDGNNALHIGIVLAADGSAALPSGIGSHLGVIPDHDRPGHAVTVSVIRPRSGTDTRGFMIAAGGHLRAAADGDVAGHFAAKAGANTRTVIVTARVDDCVIQNLNGARHICVRAGANAGTVVSADGGHIRVAADGDAAGFGHFALIAGADTGPFVRAAGADGGTVQNFNGARHFALIAGADACTIIAADGGHVCVAANGDAAGHLTPRTRANARAVILGNGVNIRFARNGHVAGEVAVCAGADGGAVAYAQRGSGGQINITVDGDAAGEFLFLVGADHGAVGFLIGQLQLAAGLAGQVQAAVADMDQGCVGLRGARVNVVLALYVDGGIAAAHIDGGFAIGRHIQILDGDICLRAFGGGNGDGIIGGGRAGDNGIRGLQLVLGIALRYILAGIIR